MELFAVNKKTGLKAKPLAVRHVGTVLSELRVKYENGKDEHVEPGEWELEAIIYPLDTNFPDWPVGTYRVVKGNTQA